MRMNLQNFASTVKGYTIVGFALVKSTIKSILPGQKVLIIDPVVRPPVKTKPRLPVVVPELLPPAEAATVDKQFEALHQRNYDAFTQQYSWMMERFNHERATNKTARGG